MRSDWPEYEELNNCDFDDCRDDDSARLDLPADRHRSRASDLSGAGERAIDQECGWNADRFAIAGSAVFFAGIFSRATVGGRIRRERFVGIESWSNESEADRACESRRRSIAGGESGQAGADRLSDHIRLGTRSAHFTRRGGVSSAARRTRTRNE